MDLRQAVPRGGVGGIELHSTRQCGQRLYGLAGLERSVALLRKGRRPLGAMRLAARFSTRSVGSGSARRLRNSPSELVPSSRRSRAISFFRPPAPGK
jgi:hypothetical protein